MNKQIGFCLALTVLVGADLAVAQDDTAPGPDVTWPETCPASLPYPSGNDLRCHNGQHEATREYLLKLSARVDSLESDLEALTPEPTDLSMLPSQFHAYRSDTTVWWVRPPILDGNHSRMCGSVGFQFTLSESEERTGVSLYSFTIQQADDGLLLCSGTMNLDSGYGSVRVTGDSRIVAMWAVHQTGLSHLLK